jgi:hypothetical protein
MAYHGKSQLVVFRVRGKGDHQRANVIKLFLSVASESSFKATVLVRLDSKCFPGTNTHAYYENV